MFLIRTRTIRFDKIINEIDYLAYTTISDSSIQEIIIKYCSYYNIRLKSLQLNAYDCIVKIKGTKLDAYNLFMFLLTHYGQYFKNIQY